MFYHDTKLEKKTGKKIIENIRFTKENRGVAEMVASGWRPIDSMMHSTEHLLNIFPPVLVVAFVNVV